MTDDSADPRSSADERPTNRTIRLSVPDAGCRGNLRRFADDLRRAEGVLEVATRRRSGTVVVTYDPDRTSEAAIAAAVERPRSVDAVEPPREDRRSGCGCRCGPRR